ncbi:Mut7-C RNAse domain-containing protein [Sulfuricystis multivorans]|uniref:Mut7-C RNAse domain-containing protein n=1 Tax=Sulfuricystis multivorans TaxID=2211108 RepID=UPI000F8313FF|nr:Mut7-C RNAse domain-containing protein [Sulfuricystis multivorans]
MASATFRFYAELNAFLPLERRQRDFVVKLARAATTKHMIEACGVPHTEVAYIFVNGEPASFSRLLKDGDRVAVYPAIKRLDLSPLAPLNAPPPGRPSFIADCHLGGLARMLRMAGFDTAFRNDYDDREIAELADRESRIVLTRDLELLKLRTIRYGAYVHALKAEAQFAEVVRRFDLLPHFAPFSRCLLCNVLLRDVAKEVVIDQLPPSVREHQRHFRRCPSCQRIYWPGSHWERMQAMLSAAVRR